MPNKPRRKTSVQRRFSHVESLEGRRLMAADFCVANDPIDPILSESAAAEIAPLSIDNASHSMDAGPVRRIVNGDATSDFPAVGIVNGGCTGTLISPTHVLTAAHCVEPGGRGQFEINGQTYQASRVTIHPQYNDALFYLGYDIAIMELSQPVAGVEPMQILRDAPQAGDTLTLVGFGETGSSRTGSNFDFGNKQVGETELEEVTSTHLNWAFDNHGEANTAPGDSGGPAFVQVNGEYLIAGITSGGDGDAHAIGSGSFDTRVDNLAAWIDSIAGTSSDDPADPPVNPPSADDHADKPGADATLLQLTDGRADATGVLEQTGDRDVFQIDLADDAMLNVSLNSSQIDTFLRVYDEAGNLVAQNDDANGTLNSQLELDLAAGTYFVAAGGYADSQQGAYSLAVIADNTTKPDPTPTDDHVDNIGADATVISIDDSGRGQATGTLEAAGDRDMFSLQLDGASTVSISLGSSEIDTYLRVFDANGQLVGENDDANGTLNSQLTLDLAAGVYYISAGGYADGEQGAYALDVAAESQADPAPPSDNPSPFPGAQAVELNDTRTVVNGQVAAGEEAFYSFVPDQSGRMTITVRGEGAFDSFLTVFDSLGNEIRFNDDFRGGPDSRLRLDVTAGETYYVSVSDYDLQAGQFRTIFRLREATATARSFAGSSGVGESAGGEAPTAMSRPSRIATLDRVFATERNWRWWQ